MARGGVLDIEQEARGAHTMRWERFKTAVATLALATGMAAVGVGTAGADKVLRLSTVHVAERDSVLEVGFELSGKPDYEVAFSDGAVHMTLSPVVMAAERQVYDVNHPLLSRVVVRQTGRDRVSVWLLTRDFKASQLEGAVRVDSSADGLRLAVGQEVLSTPAKATDPAGPADVRAGAALAGTPWDTLHALRNNLPSREAVAAMAGMLLASLLAGWLIQILMVRRRRSRTNLHVVSEMKLGPGRRMLVVEAEGRRLLVSVEPDGMRLIADLDGKAAPQPVETAPIPEQAITAPCFSFAETDARLLRAKNTPRRAGSDNMEIAS